mgnify:CR=1 FL=1
MGDDAVIVLVSPSSELQKIEHYFFPAQILVGKIWCELCAKNTTHSELRILRPQKDLRDLERVLHSQIWYRICESHDNFFFLNITLNATVNM